MKLVPSSGDTSTDIHSPRSLISVIFLGMRPASCTHNFGRGRKKLASVSPVDS